MTKPYSNLVIEGGMSEHCARGISDFVSIDPQGDSDDRFTSS